MGGEEHGLESDLWVDPPSDGEVIYEGRVMTHDSPGTKLEAGIYHIPQEQFLFQ